MIEAPPFSSTPMDRGHKGHMPATRHLFPNIWSMSATTCCGKSLIPKSSSLVSAADVSLCLRSLICNTILYHKYSYIAFVKRKNSNVLIKAVNNFNGIALSLKDVCAADVLIEFHESWLLLWVVIYWTESNKWDRVAFITQEVLPCSSYQNKLTCVKSVLKCMVVACVANYSSFTVDAVGFIAVSRFLNNRYAQILHTTYRGI